MAYIRLVDYYKTIQSSQIDQLTGGVNTVRLAAELVAQEEITSHLTQKYDIASEFSDTLTWDPLVAYVAKKRVQLTASAYSATSIYALKSLVLQGGNIYICITAILMPEPFTANKWTLLGAQYDLFYVTLPKPEFNFETVYSVGDQVFWKNKTYTCLIGSVIYTHGQALQFYDTANIPASNVAPDNASSGLKYWGVGVAYTLAAGVLPTDSTKWTAGDNRSQKIVECMVDIAVYKMSPRSAPTNVPGVRQIRNDDAILWLKACAKGTVTANIPLIQPKQGSRIRHGSNIKNQNSYILIPLLALWKIAVMCMLT